ncbi:hypothetical protein F5883DRAFT_588868, partial [Diaporthe sp. PMI_573]
VLGTITALLGVVSHLAIFNQVDWRLLAPLLLWIYSALAVLLFLLLNSFEPKVGTCFKYLFVLIMLYCTGLFTSISIVESLRRRRRPSFRSGPEEIALDLSSPAVLEGFGITLDSNTQC